MITPCHANAFMFDDGVIWAVKKRVRKCVTVAQKHYMAATPLKFQIMFLGIPDDREITFDISDFTLKSSPAVKLLGVFLDRKLNIKSHIQSLCKSASQKLKALLRIRPQYYINAKCTKRLCEAYYTVNIRLLSTYMDVWW